MCITEQLNRISKFPGSLRAMQQNYQDAMAIVRKIGKLDLFITFTCNPRWTEIAESIEAYQKPEYRPDIIAKLSHETRRIAL